MPRWAGPKIIFSLVWGKNYLRSPVPYPKHDHSESKDPLITSDSLLKGLPAFKTAHVSVFPFLPNTNSTEESKRSESRIFLWKVKKDHALDFVFNFHRPENLAKMKRDKIGGNTDKI